MFWKTERKGKQAESGRDQSHPGKSSRRMLNLRCSALRVAVCLAVSVLFSLDLCKGASPGSEDGQGHFSREGGQVDVEVDGQGDFVAGAAEKGRRTMTDIGTFLEATNYTTRSPRPASPVQSDDGNSGKSCTVEITSPRLGHNGDAAAAPRIARTRAWVEAHVRGEACVQADGFTLTEDIQILVLVDGEEEEGVSRASALSLQIPGLDTGTHTLQVSAISFASGQVVAQAGPLEFVTLPDVEVLFPDHGHAFSPHEVVMLAVAVSPTALANHVCDAGGAGVDDRGECVVPEDDRADSLQMFINGQSAAFIKMSADDGDDGRRTYHVNLGEMLLGDYDIRVTMAREGGRGSIGESARTKFAVVECAENGRECSSSSSSSSLEFAGDGVGSLYSECRKPSKPLCREVRLGKEDEVCSGHGSCQDDVCACHGDWIGETCSHSLLQEATYMPETDPAVWEGRCKQAVAWNAGSRELVRRLEQLHRSDRCSNQDMMLFESRMHGLGAQVHYLTECLTTAWIAGQGALVVPPFMGSVDCSSQTSGHSLLNELFACHLTPYAQCDAASLDTTADVGQPEQGLGRFDGGVGGGVSGGGLGDIDKGAFWWRSHLAWFLIQPSASLSASIRLVKASIGWSHAGGGGGGGGVLGVHVRHGDACMHAQISNFRPECVPFSAYVERIKEMRRMYGVNKVFLATDDPAVVDEARALEGFKVMSLDIDRAMLSGDWFLEFRTQGQSSAIKSQDVTGSALLDLMLLSDCDFFIGSFASHLSRLAYELMVARLGFHPPYSSVDYPWCFSFLEKTEVPGFGMVNC